MVSSRRRRITRVAGRAVTPLVGLSRAWNFVQAVFVLTVPSLAGLIAGVVISPLVGVLVLVSGLTIALARGMYLAQGELDAREEEAPQLAVSGLVVRQISFPTITERMGIDTLQARAASATGPEVTVRHAVAPRGYMVVAQIVNKRGPQPRDAAKQVGVQLRCFRLNGQEFVGRSEDTGRGLRWATTSGIFRRTDCR